MKLFTILSLLLFSNHLLAECNWSKESPIRNLTSVTFEYCEIKNKIRINSSVELKPNIPINLSNSDCSECNNIWAIQSPDTETIYVYIENQDYQRNGWIVDLLDNRQEHFVINQMPVGKQYLPKFLDNARLHISYVSESRSNELLLVKQNGSWVSEMWK